jgi:hypothetical protein
MLKDKIILQHRNVAEKEANKILLYDSMASAAYVKYTTKSENNSSYGTVSKSPANIWILIGKYSVKKMHSGNDIFVKFNSS